MATESAQTITIRIPIAFDLEGRQLIAEDILEFIRNRTERGLDKNNNSFARYSDSYVESIDFKIAGKSKNQVDLELSGDMMSALDIIDIRTAGFITIGYQRSEENDKAAWQRNNLRPSFPKRDFLGITDKDLNKIISRYTYLLDEQVREESKKRSRIQEEASRILSRIRF